MSDEIILSEIREELGWADQADTAKIIARLVANVMTCRKEIDWLHAQIDNLREVNQRGKNE